MQKVIEFRKRNFWSSRLDVNQLNEKIAQYNKDGWRVIQVVPSFTFLGFISSYTLLLENNAL